MEIGHIFLDGIDEGISLYSKHVNPVFWRVLRTIGLSRRYVRGEGAYLYDAEGRRYLDFLSGYGVFVIGRSHPRLKEVLHKAIDLDLPNMVQMDTPPLAGILAKRLLSKLPSHLDTVFFTNSGTEANEGAIKFARAATGRPRVLYLEHAFHGLTLGSLSVNGNEEFRSGFEPLLPGCVPIRLGDIDALKRELAKGDVAAFIYEVIQGKGVYLPPPGFLEEAEALCKAHGTLTIADEVQTGFGRTGRYFAFEHYSLSPDIVTVAKALSGGYIPIGAICYRRDIYNKVYSSMDRCVVHSNTFGRNVLAMVAGLASLEVIDEERLVENAEAMGRAIRDGISAMRGRYEMIREVRGKGLMVGIEFARPSSKGLALIWDGIKKINEGLLGQMVVIPLFSDFGILTQVSGHGAPIVKLLPPLIIGMKEVEYFLKSFDKVMELCHSIRGAASLAKRLALNLARR